VKRIPSGPSPRVFSRFLCGCFRLSSANFPGFSEMYSAGFFSPPLPGVVRGGGAVVKRAAQPLGRGPPRTTL